MFTADQPVWDIDPADIFNSEVLDLLRDEKTFLQFFSDILDSLLFRDGKVYKPTTVIPREAAFYRSVVAGEVPDGLT